MLSVGMLNVVMLSVISSAKAPHEAFNPRPQI
jgi:hypothetical protein